MTLKSKKPKQIILSGLDQYLLSYCNTIIWSESVRQWPGRPGFNPTSSHTKDSKNGT